MTARRYHHYWRALELLRVVDTRRSFSADRDLLADLAEEMLLTRGDQPVVTPMSGVTDCLVRLIRTGALHRSVAKELWRAIAAAGPGERSGAQDQPLVGDPS